MKFLISSRLNLPIHISPSTSFNFEKFSESPGSGKTFDWESLKKADCGNKKLFLAGGLTPDNVKAAIEAVRSDVVDISSGVEYDDVYVKGKDESKVKAFIQNAKY